MDHIKFTNNDFKVFEIDGLEQRMQALTSLVRPKFQELGDKFSSYLSSKTGDEFFPHVAKHARRTVNPPKDSWVAFAPYKRGYKSLPHFQIGLWNTHLFIIVAIIYEAPHKSEMATRLLNSLECFDELPNDFILSGDHMSQEAIPLRGGRDKQLEELLIRLRDVKKGEFLVGRHISREDAIKLTSEQLEQLIENTFEALIPTYNIIIGR